MTGSVIQLVMNFGYPGSYSRMPDDVVMNKPVNSGSANIVFGTAVKLNADNTFAAGDATLTAANFAGIAVREVKQGLAYSTLGVVDNAQGSYQPLDPCDVLLRGCTVVKLGAGKTEGKTPAAGASVLYRIALDAENAPNAHIGDFEAGEPEAGKTIALPGVVFTTGEVDANGVVEVSITKRNNN